jgi:hypothetical protein
VSYDSSRESNSLTLRVAIVAWRRDWVGVMGQPLGLKAPRCESVMFCAAADRPRVRVDRGARTIDSQFSTPETFS